ncbi:hypothetical protein [Lacticaseibacillus rhamnosus]
MPVFKNYETAAAVLFEYVHAFYKLWKVNAVLNVS